MRLFCEISYFLGTVFRRSFRAIATRRRLLRPAAQQVGEFDIFPSTYWSYSTMKCRVEYVLERQPGQSMLAGEDLASQFSRFKSVSPDFSLEGENIT